MSKGFKVLGCFGLGAAGILGAGYALAFFKPQITIGLIQKLIYKNGEPINSYEPKRTPGAAAKENGIWYVNDIQYGTKYPNSFLDISYPDSNLDVSRPTVVFFHGGGFFGGDKAMGDPMSSGDSHYDCVDGIVKAGYNLVNVNYALVPDYHWPVPLIQTCEAMDYLYDHAEELHLDMTRVAVSGGSAGAVLTAQYGCILTNPSYADYMGIHTHVPVENVKCLLIVDGPFTYQPNPKGLRLNMLMGNYFGGTASLKLNAKAIHDANAMEHVTDAFPPSWFTAGTDDGFPYDMQAFADLLTSHHIDTSYFVIDTAEGLTKHGYMDNMRTDPQAKRAFDSMMEFLGKYLPAES